MKAIGWSRDARGIVQRYILRDTYSNCVTTFCGGGIGKDKATGMYHTSLYAYVAYEI